MAFYQLYNKNNFLFEGLDVVDVLDCDMFEVEILGPLDVCGDAIYIYRKVLERKGEIMIPITDERWNEMYFMGQLYNEVCKFIDSMILCNEKPVTEDDIVWIVNRIGDSMYMDRLAAQCSLYSALYTKYIKPKEIEKMVLYGTDIQQVIVDEPCVLKDIPPTDEMFLPDNRESRRHGYNYAKETSYKKPNRRRPWE
jgi:hypothetical protein